MGSLARESYHRKGVARSTNASIGIGTGYSEEIELYYFGWSFTGLDNANRGIRHLRARLSSQRAGERRCKMKTTAEPVCGKWPSYPRLKVVKGERGAEYTSASQDP